MMSVNRHARDPNDGGRDVGALGGTPGAIIPGSTRFRSVSAAHNAVAPLLRGSVDTIGAADSSPKRPPLSKTRAQRRTPGAGDFAKHGAGSRNDMLKNQTRGGAARTDHTHTATQHGRFENPPIPH